MTTTTRTRMLSAGTLIGDTVRNRGGEKLGTLKEIVLDTETGHIAYAVLDFGGFLGIGSKLFAVPWRALTVDTEDKCLLLEVSKQVLENAEGFDPDNWPDFADRQWGARIYSHYSTTPYWTGFGV